ncbi:ribosome-associated translation inhibitor RaiA [Aquihabitans sp. G128]|nr:ribosome-associated translation inhibitor RaiA [Aquihabitans sp. G128]QXC62795.1 ribosome-associated translation inhibitor RaiA [Aquihabitans sp. G128]
MQVTVSRRHTEVSDSLRVMTEEKIGRLARFVDGLDHAEVHFSEHKNPRIADKEVCEVTIEGHGHHVRCKVQAPDGFAAVDKAYDKLEHQLHKLKTKLRQRYQGAPKAKKGADSLGAVVTLEEAPVDVDLTDDDVEVEGPKIVKSKRFAMFPMSAEEAAQRMDLIGHGFFFFTNAETSRAAVVYRRDDGQVGLIDEAD